MRLLQLRPSTLLITCVALSACAAEVPGEGTNNAGESGRGGASGASGTGAGRSGAANSGSGNGGTTGGTTSGGGNPGQGGSTTAAGRAGNGNAGSTSGGTGTGGKGSAGEANAATGGMNAPGTGGASEAGTGGSAAGVGGAVATGGAGGAGALAGSAGNGGSGATANITLWLAGDSTMANGNSCPIGWGQEFAPYFNERVKVVNSAVGGRSVRTWLYNVGTTMDTDGECVLARDAQGNPTLQSRWQAMLDGMKAGDYLFIQFGINDGSADCDRHVGLDAFKESYGVMAAAAKERGAQPIFLTPVSSISCNGSTARGTRGSFVTATSEAGEEYDVPVIDLHELSVALYNELGFCPIPGGGDVSASTPGDVGAFFCDDHTHFDRPGAVEIAGIVAGALRSNGLPLAAYLK